MGKSLETYEDCLEDKFYGSLLRIFQVAPTHNKIYTKGFTTAELRDLLTYDYTMTKGRVSSLENLRKYIVKNNPEIRLDQLKKKSPQNFNDKLNNIKNRFTSKIDNHWILINRYKFALMKKWHTDNISSCSLDSVIPVRKITYYFPNNAIKLYDPDVTRDDLRKLNEISNGINEKFREVQDIFWEIGKRKGVRKAFEIIENLDCEDEMKILIACHVIVRESLVNIAHNVLLPVKETYSGLELFEHSYKSHIWEEKLWNELLKYAVLKFISKEFKKSKKELDQLLYIYENEKYEEMSYSLITGYAMILIHEAMLNSRYFIPICEQPNLFLADGNAGFTEKEINLLKEAKTLKDFHEANEEIKELSGERIDLKKHERELQERIDAQEYIFDEFYHDFFEDRERDKLAYYLQQKEDGFRKSKFLDGFEDQLKKFAITKDMIYNEMDKWFNLFEAISIGYYED